MDSPLKGCDVVFILPHLGPGGAQRVASIVLNQLASTGLNVALLTTLDNKPDVHTLNPAVRRVKLTLVDYGEPERVPKFYDRWIGLRLCYRSMYSFARAALKPLIAGVTVRLIRIIFRLSNSRSSPSYFCEGDCLLALARSIAGKKERRLRRLLQAAPPPCILSFLTQTNIIVTLAAFGLPTRVVISERNDPDLQHISPIWHQLRLFTYPQAHMVTSNSKGVLVKLGAMLGDFPAKLLPNPLLIPAEFAAHESRFPRFIIVGRLEHQKGIDILLTAFASISSKIPEWSLDIVGDGSLLSELEQQSCDLKLGDRVKFHGHLSQPWALLSRAGVFILPSRFEGMPNSLLEAMAAGLPCIVSDASPGLLELIVDEETGLVVPVEDYRSLAVAMQRLAVDSDLRCRIGANAKSYISKNEWHAVEPVWREVLSLPQRSARVVRQLT